jgi:hypothetical protein
VPELSGKFADKWMGELGENPSLRSVAVKTDLEACATMHAIFVRRRNTKGYNRWRLSTDRTFVCLHLYHDDLLTLREGGRERDRKRGRREGGRERGTDGKSGEGGTERQAGREGGREGGRKTEKDGLFGQGFLAKTGGSDVSRCPAKTFSSRYGWQESLRSSLTACSQPLVSR